MSVKRYDMKEPDNLRDSTNYYGVNFTGSSSIKSVDLP